MNKILFISQQKVFGLLFKGKYKNRIILSFLSAQKKIFVRSEDIFKFLSLITPRDGKINCKH